MQGRIVLISDDSDFYDYLLSRFSIRKYDEVFRFNFGEIPEKLHLLSTSLLIINSENKQQNTIELLQILKGTPSIVFNFNVDEDFRLKVLSLGANAFVTPMTTDEELKALITSSLNISSILEKNKQYREMLVRKNLISPNNEVLIDYSSILDTELNKLSETASQGVLVAISPDDKSKFLIQPNQIETIILNNIRRNDILMNYAVNKYFLLLYDTEIEGAKQLWAKIQKQIPEKIYAGFAKTLSKSRQQLVNEVLNKLHETINYEKTNLNNENSYTPNNQQNFKLFKQEFNKQIEKVINPAFFNIKQKYSDKLFNMALEQKITEKSSSLIIKGRNCTAELKITTPGFSKINIDIISSLSNDNINANRISLNPNEFEIGLLEDLLERFILEFKEEIANGKT